MHIGTAAGSAQERPDQDEEGLTRGHGNAGLIPGQIAEQLRGRAFASFDDFRSAFWMAVANDPVLSTQLSAANVASMKKGMAPVAVKTQQLGDQRSYILHHKTPIQHGGGVYDLDNLGGHASLSQRYSTTWLSLLNGTNRINHSYREALKRRLRV